MAGYQPGAPIPLTNVKGYGNPGNAVAVDPTGGGQASGRTAGSQYLIGNKPSAAGTPGGSPAERSYVLPTYGGWSNLGPGEQGQRLQQTGGVTFQGARPEGVGPNPPGALRPANPQYDPATSPMALPQDNVVAEPGWKRMGAPIAQAPGLSAGHQPGVNSSLWRFSQGQGRF